MITDPQVLRYGPVPGKVAPRHLFSIEDLGREGILSILDRAEELRTKPVKRSRFAGKILGLLFFEPSTRTRFGFHAAMIRLGGSAIESNETKYQPGMTRPESLADTVRCISAYCDGIVLRHPSLEQFRAAMAAAIVPVVNGGCGTIHHPTQTLIDLLAIRSRLGRIEGLRIGVVGDLSGSRSASSLVRALVHFDPAELRLISPGGYEMSSSFLRDLPSERVTVTNALALAGLDVVYMAGLPERSKESEIPEKTRVEFGLSTASMSSLEPAALVLCPLPRIDEIAVEVDRIERAGYFEQSNLGLFARMAILAAYLEN
jgi:aspartate carbamoyltransferase catalytic subunit